VPLPAEAETHKIVHVNRVEKSRNVRRVAAQGLSIGGSTKLRRRAETGFFHTSTYFCFLKTGWFYFLVLVPLGFASFNEGFMTFTSSALCAAASTDSHDK
jgi:hypothetical protein